MNTRRKSPSTKPVNLDAPKKKEYKEPKSWSIITALNRVLDQAKDSELSDEFYETCEKPLAYLRSQLGLTDIQIVVLAMLIEAGEPMSWRMFGNYLGCSRLSMMVYSEEVEELIKKRWLVRKPANDMGRYFEGVQLVHGVVTALRHNQVFIPEKIDGLDEQTFIDKLEGHIAKNIHDFHADFKDDEEWMLQLAEANPHLPLCQEVLNLNDIHIQSLLLMMVFDYAQWAGTSDEGLTYDRIDDLYPDDYECDHLRRKLRDGSHILIQKGFVEHHCEDGMADTERYMLTKQAKEKFLSNYIPNSSRRHSSTNQFLKSFSKIKEKTLFYNSSDQEQVDRLKDLLTKDSLNSIQQRLEEQGMRKGVACLFYGAPGTGKTETVLQLARQTGRDIMQVNIAGLRDKYVGESENNIKKVFTRYRDICKTAEVTPILFFNEADAIFGVRTSINGVNPSVQKMDNAMQNIILQEMEDLEGILIATTNLTQNLDSAFERRFLFKIEFHKPNTEVKAKIWNSMIKDISSEEAKILANKFDFSGGQIENVARKRTIDYILSGKIATLADLERYCQNELLDNKRDRRQVVGFSM